MANNATSATSTTEHSKSTAFNHTARVEEQHESTASNHTTQFEDEGGDMLDTYLAEPAKESGCVMVLAGARGNDECGRAQA